MGRFKYTESEKDTLKVLKMQEQQLEKLTKKLNALEQDKIKHENLESLKGRIKTQLERQGIPYSPQEQIDIPESSRLQVNNADIPSWDDCVQQANKEFPGEVELEDLLSKEEFNFCVEEVERINAEFSCKTSIFNKKDLAFLAIATALQTARWIIIQEFMGDLGQQIDGNSRLLHNDKRIKENTKKSNKAFQRCFEQHGHKRSLKSYKSWEQIIFSSAPYDTSLGSHNFGENLEGRYHRYKTLGHDPILGWIFGSANFITDTCTLSNFNSYRISRVGSPHFSTPVGLPTIFYEVFDSVREDWLRLPAGVFAQFVHLKSDVFTKLGLPVPLLSSFSEALAGKLYKSQYDSLCLLKDIAIIDSQASSSILINMLVGLIHGLLYNENEDGDRELYEVRTRKILSISNALSSAGNLAYVLVTEDPSKLDAGGLLVSLYRLFSDVRFMTRVKQSFIENKMDKLLENELKELDSYFID
ncbi:MAG: hypothetical protein ACTTI8_00010 [Prevotella intermedia]